MKIKKHVGIFRAIRTNSSENEIIAANSMAKSFARTVQDFYRGYAGRFWDVQVRGYVILSDEATVPPYFASTSIAKFIEENDMEGFEPNYFHVVGGYHAKNYCGQGQLPGSQSVTYEGCGVGTTIHELGHNFGLHHASDMDVNGKVVEYGDDSSIMGYSYSKPGFNSVDIVRLGLETEREVKHITQTEQVLLCPISMSEHGMHDNEFQHAIINTDDREFHVSLRKGKGVRYHIPHESASSQRIFVHERLRDLRSMHIHPMLGVGEELHLPNGVKVQMVEYANETARVNIFMKEDNPPPDVEMPVGFPPAPMDAVVDVQHNGLWYDSDYTGEGFDVQVKNGRVLVYWYTFDVDRDSREFYWGTADLTDGPVEFDLYMTRQGSWNRPTSATAYNVGKARLYFTEGVGTFDFNTSRHGRGCVKVTAINNNQSEKSGTFYQPSRSGEGFTVQLFDDEEVCTAAWYTYTNATSIYGGTGQYNQQWFMCQGNKVSEGVYELTVYEIQGRKWMEQADDPNPTERGTATLTFKNDNEIDFDYDIHYGAGTFNLERLF